MPRLRKEKDDFWKYRRLVYGASNDWTKGELCERVGVCPKTLNTYLENPEKMPIGVMRRLNRVLGISAEDCRDALPMW